MRLTGILFNHDTNSSRTSAINIRRDFLRAAPRPEWVPGMALPDQSPAAYAVRELDLDNVSIKVRVEAPELAGRSVEIGANRPQVPDMPAAWQDWLNQLLFVAPVLYYYWRHALNTLWTVAYELQDDVLGAIPPTRVRIGANGESGWHDVKLTNHQLRDVGVGRHQISWRWRHRSTGDPRWTEFEQTRHTIYTVLRTPTKPWLQAPFQSLNTQLPWTTALDRACTWAQGTTDVNQAAERITKAVYDLGGELFEYGCSIGAVTVYSEPHFNLTKFLERVAGGLGLGRFINCSDCATFVSTLSNLIGADLWQSQMRDFDRPFPVNPIKAIGDHLWAPPCGIGLFAYHEVAWDGQATVDDSVYDACCEVDAATDILRRHPVLPARMRFGEPGEGQYRDFLAAPFGREACKPQPQLKRRRVVF